MRSIKTSFCPTTIDRRPPGRRSIVYVSWRVVDSNMQRGAFTSWSAAYSINYRLKKLNDLWLPKSIKTGSHSLAISQKGALTCRAFCEKGQKRLSWRSSFHRARRDPSFINLCFVVQNRFVHILIEQTERSSPTNTDDKLRVCWFMDRNFRTCINYDDEFRHFLHKNATNLCPNLCRQNYVIKTRFYNLINSQKNPKFLKISQKTRKSPKIEGGCRQKSRYPLEKSTFSIIKVS